MGNRKLMFRLIILIIFHLLTSASPYECPFAFYGSSAFNARLPFRIINHQPDICGYPRFELTCNNPYAGDFSVKNIDYRGQVVQVCIASSRLNLLGSPFPATPTRNYTLLCCLVEVAMSRYINVRCVGNSSYSNLDTFFEIIIEEMTKQNACRITGSLWSPLSRYQDQKGLHMSCISLTCCLADGETCGSTIQEIAFDENNKKGNKKRMIAFIIISIVLALPAIAASIVMDCKDDRRVVTWIPATDETAAIPDQTTTISHIGLDQLTIESYTKVILEENKRLPGHEDAVCAICLSEYDVKEIVRCIPECRHCFHADCIDEWLNMKGTCPVCRHSPLYL